MNTFQRIVGLACAFAIAMLLVAAPTQAQDVVRIGFASPLIGGQASYGKDNQNGAQMAIRIEFPPMQPGASFNLEAVKAQIEKARAAHGQ